MVSVLAWNNNSNALFATAQVSNAPTLSIRGTAINPITDEAVGYKAFTRTSLTMFIISHLFVLDYGLF
jgi:hypothetical protein